MAQYVKIVRASYDDSIAVAKTLRETINALVTEPSQKTLDAARTAEIAMMVAFHAAYDVDMLAPDLGVEPREGGLKALQVATGSLFLFLVGVSLFLAHGNGIRWRAFLIRFAMVAGAALASNATSLPRRRQESSMVPASPRRVNAASLVTNASSVSGSAGRSAT